MEDHKKRYLNVFIDWSNMGLVSLIEIVKQEEDKLRACYQMDIGPKSQEFVKIIVVDAAFIIVFLIKFHSYWDPSDYVFSSPMVVNQVRMDVMLLENQLPFFILVELFGHVAVPFLHGERPSIHSLCHHLCGPFIDLVATKSKLKKIESYNVKHLIDFLRYMVVPLENPHRGPITTLNTPSITKLHQAGVRFRVRRGKRFDFDFKGGTFVISRFRLGPDDEIYIRNLLAFEQCSVDKYYITDYVAVMCRLLSTQNDVDLLIENEILDDVKHNNKTLTSLLHGITAGTGHFYHAFSFGKLCDDLNNYYNEPWHKWLADLKQKYFSTPWAAISVIGGFVLLVLTLIQTVCSVIALQSSNKNGFQN